MELRSRRHTLNEKEAIAVQLKKRKCREPNRSPFFNLEALPDEVLSIIMVVVNDRILGIVRRWAERATYYPESHHRSDKMAMVHSQSKFTALFRVNKTMGARLFTQQGSLSAFLFHHYCTSQAFSDVDDFMTRRLLMGVNVFEDSEDKRWTSTFSTGEMICRADHQSLQKVLDMFMTHTRYLIYMEEEMELSIEEYGSDTHPGAFCRCFSCEETIWKII